MPRPTVRPGWPGERFAPGGLATFRDRTGREVTGKVVELRRNHAIIAGGGSGRWQVGYRLLWTEEAARPGFTLGEIETIANRLMDKHGRSNGLSEKWQVAFDLAPARAGQCAYSEQRIYLSVGHCLKASRAEVRDTILHEIAHALAGPRHHHDAVWQRIARTIGCTARRCTTTRHAGGRWIARCKCGMTYSRHRLTKRMRTQAICTRCGQGVSWQIDGTGESIR